MTDRPLVDWFGVPYNNEGYGKHCREIVTSIDEEELDLSVIPTRKDRTSQLTKEQTKKLKMFNKGMRNEINTEEGGHYTDAIEVWNLNPMESYNVSYSQHSFSDVERYKIIYTVYEAKNIPSEWVSLVEKFDELWCPSQFALDSFLNAGVNIDNTLVVPEGVDTELYQSAKPLFDFDEFVFFSLFDFTHRKGYDKLIEAYCEEFDEEDDVLLFLKTHYAGIQNFNNSYVLNKIRDIKDEFNETAKVKVLIDFLEEEKMPSLFSSGDCFVLPTRGEGFGLPIFEAASCGLPVITTKATAPFEYLDGRYVYWVEVEDWEKYPLKKAVLHEPNCVGLDFAEPSLESLKEQMRYCYEHRDNLTSPDVTDLTWDKGAKIATERLKEIWSEIND